MKTKISNIEMLKKRNSIKWYNQLVKNMKEYDLACERGEVPSGNYCLSCQRYNCGHYLDDIGGVISKSAHMKLNKT
jgi:hypothetical protein